MDIVYSKDAAKTIARIDVSTRRRIGRSIHSIPAGDIKPLKGATGIFRLRVGDWRILFSYLEDHIYIREIAPRGDVYKGV